MYKTFDQLSDEARVWIYQAHRFLSDAELQTASKALRKFVETWKSHGQDVVGSFEIRYSRFIVLAAEQRQGEVSGCSIDSSVAVLKSLEQDLSVDLFDRTLVIWKEGSEMREAPMSEFWALRKSENVGDDTVVFNNLVRSKAEYRSGWECKFADSWHSEMW